MPVACRPLGKQCLDGRRAVEIIGGHERDDLATRVEFVDCLDARGRLAFLLVEPGYDLGAGAEPAAELR
jgi:hypothetical protein